MAKVNYGTIVNDARGKVNGTVFSKNKSGAYTRKKVTPANPQTAAQVLVRANFAQLSKAWSGTLTAVQRAAWISYANTYPRIDIFGASITITGLNMFISLNQILLLCSAAIITTPPPSNVILPVPIDPTLSVITAPSTLEYKTTAAAPTVTSLMLIYATKPLPAGRQPQPSDYRFLVSAPAPATGFPAIVNIGGYYATKFGSFATGQNIGVLVATTDTLTGLTTQAVQVGGIAS